MTAGSGATRFASPSRREASCVLGAPSAVHDLARSAFGSAMATPEAR
jgi:hypothetical protein